MVRIVQNSSKLLMFTLLVVLMAIGGGCKSKKKAAEAAAAAERARIEQEAALKKQQEEEAARKAREEEEAARRAAEEAKKNPQSKLEQYFSSISNATNEASATASINEALTMFGSPDTPVLIVIYEGAGQKDYDRPTTIKNYLYYLKDQKKKADKIGDLKFDSSGKITEVELIKQ